MLIFGPELNKHHRFVGCIDQHCNVVHILQDAYDDAKLLCDHYYADSPDIEVSLVNGETYFNMSLSCKGISVFAIYFIILL